MNGIRSCVLSTLLTILVSVPVYASSRSDMKAGYDALRRQDHDRAISLFTSAIGGGDLNRPNLALAYHYRGAEYLKTNRYDEAIADLDRAIMLEPVKLPAAYSDRGIAYRRKGDYAKAIALAKDYVDAHFNEALALLTVGEYARGFAEYEWRWKRAGVARRSLGKPLWLGEYPLGRKTILLHAEQGLGDTIQFARYAPLLAQGGATVLLEVQPELKDLLSGLEGVRVFARGEALPAFDVHCPLGSLPLAFKTTLTTVPVGIPYLGASEERIATWGARLEALPGKRVALAWAGNPNHINDRNRSIALARLAPLLSMPGVSVVGIQRDVPESDRAPLAGLTHLGEELADFQDTAAVIALCDLVVTVDTSVAHLAGAMGRPLWVLLPFWPDWRWTLGAERSPWYPDARLYRQGANGDWDAVIARLAAEIAIGT